MTGYIHSLETFGSVDGPGVRYVIFMAGCPMRCKYCHNPDTWNIKTGTEHTADELLDKAEKYRSYWGKLGGITVSGGEPMMQIDFLTELFEKAKDRGINTCLDTSGVIFDRNNSEILAKTQRLIKSTDLVMLDIKHIDDEEHKKLTSHSNKNILDFAKFLDENNIPIWIRHVVVPEITFKHDELLKLGQFLKGLHNIKKIETLPYHTLGIAKYDSLKIDYPLRDTPPLSQEDADKALDIIKEGMKWVKKT